MLIDVQEANRRLLLNEASLLDVREEPEWAAGRAPGASLLPMSQLSNSANRELDPGVTYMVICRSGGRSAKAVAALAANGYEVVDVEGGMLAWETAGLRMEADGGRTPTVIAAAPAPQPSTPA